MTRVPMSVRIVCVVGLMLCAGQSGRAGGLPPLLISEFRLRGSAGPTDEYIEIFNTQRVPHTVAASSGAGYAIAASDGITRCLIANGVVIPPGGHFLCVNSNGYTLATGPAGSITTATGDTSYVQDIPDNAGIALFNNNVGGSSYSFVNRIDAVGPESETNPLYKEGTGYPSISSPGPRESAWVRALSGSCATGTCTSESTPAYDTGLVDTNDNTGDFYYTDTTGGFSLEGAVQRHGAPGPQNLSAPLASTSGYNLLPTKVSGCSSSDMPPNRVRDLTPLPLAPAPLGTLDLRLKWISTSDSPITRLRFRVVDLTTFPVSPGTADLRVLSSTSTTFAVDNYPCGSSDGTFAAIGTTLEEPAQPAGGGFNSSLRAYSVTPATPLAARGSVNLRITLGVVQEGFARFCIVAETTPDVGVMPWCYVGSTQPLTELPAPGTYDGDRAAEMVTYDPVTARWTIRQSSSGFTTQRVVQLSAPGDNGTPVPGDYDGDGRMDPAIYQRSSGLWSLCLSRYNYNSIQYHYSHGGPGYDPVPGDYDGDGTTDVAVANVALHRWRFWPSSSTSFPFEVVDRDFASAGLTPLGGQDFDGDGASDMVAYNAATGFWLSSPSSSNFTTTVSQWWGGIGFTPVPGDYDGDLQADYAVYQRATGGWWVLLSGRRLTAPYAPPYSTGFSGSWGGPGSVPVPGDYDGDSRTDIAVYQAAAMRWTALLSSTSYSPSTPLSASFGTIADRPVSAAVLPAIAREIRAGDFDGDAVNDLVVYDTTSGVWAARVSGDGFMPPGGTHGLGGTGYTAVPGDYDGDGRADIGVYEQATGRWIVQRSDGHFGTQYDFNAGGSGWAPVAGDYDGDGRADMIVYNTTTGQWYGRMSASNFTAAAPLITPTWGGTGFTAAPGDFDGDGRLDISVYHEASGYWLILASMAGYSTSSPIVRWYGGVGYEPVPADFDGDGFTDLAVYQSATGLWTILRSGTAYTIGYAVGYGGTGYAPVAGDWDGDRRADLAVYQVTTGIWSIPLSGTGYAASLPATLGGVGRVPLPIFR